MDAIGYLRVSTEEQAADGVSQAAQRATLEAYAVLRKLNLIEIVTDEGVSGAKELASRPAGDRVYQLAPKGISTKNGADTWKPMTVKRILERNL